jgi:uncharacterized membrane protein
MPQQTTQNRRIQIAITKLPARLPLASATCYGERRKTQTMKKEKAYTLVELMVAIMLLAAIPIIGVLIWVAWHFILKWW